MINSLFVPTLGLDLGLLDRLAASIDCVIHSKMLLWNGPTQGCSAWLRRHQDWQPLFHPHNAGVAGSWNQAPAIFPHQKSWLICNDDVAFNPGDLDRISDAIQKYESTEPIILLNDTNPFYCFVWTKVGVDRFGLFDENFWPAYYEDNDMRVRHRLAGVQYKYALQGRPPLIHGKPRLGGMDYGSMIQGTGLFNRRYWLSKWGSYNFEHATYKTPFNADHPLSFWQLDEPRRKQMQAIHDQFITSPRVSLYDLPAEEEFQTC